MEKVHEGGRNFIRGEFTHVVVQGPSTVSAPLFHLELGRNLYRRKNITASYATLWTDTNAQANPSSEFN